MFAAPGAAAIVFGAALRRVLRPDRSAADAVARAARLTRRACSSVGDRRRAACLLAAGHVIGIVNRWREGGARLALIAPSGFAGLALLLGGRARGGRRRRPRRRARARSGSRSAALAMPRSPSGCVARRAAGGAAVGEVLIGVLDALLRTVSNVFSFSRLAAFGLDARRDRQGRARRRRRPDRDARPATLAAAAVFVVGSAPRSRSRRSSSRCRRCASSTTSSSRGCSSREGRPFRPWNLPLMSTEEAR